MTKIQMTETRSFDAFVLNFEHLIFEFVSDFGFRASNLFLCPLRGAPYVVWKLCRQYTIGIIYASLVTGLFPGLGPGTVFRLVFLSLFFRK
jgi:hypothetical protein